MKKMLLWAAMAAVAMTSCSKNEPTENNAGKVIDFGAYSQRPTVGSKATVADLDLLKGAGGGFYVAGYHAPGAYTAIDANFVSELMSTDVTWSGTAWTYSPLVYMPEGGTVNFIAFGNNVPPADGILGSGEMAFFDGDGTTDPPSITYIAPSVAADQKDLLVATSLNNTNANITLEFAHVLSRIDVEVKANTTAENLKLEIVSVTFNDIKPQGKYNLGTGDWAAEATIADPIADIPLTLVADPTQLGSAVPAFMPINTSTGGLMIIPQAMTSIDVEYKYWQKDTNDDFTILLADKTGANKVNISLTTGTPSWGKGVYYKYQLTIAPTVTPITFTTVTVPNWPTPTDSGQTL